MIEASNLSAALSVPAGPSVIGDECLMALVGQGDEAAFALLVKRHSSPLYRVALRMLDNAHEAEDVVQECFGRMWQQAPRWQPSGAGLAGWLHRVTMNLCFDRHRRFRFVTTDSLPEVADAAPQADRVIEADQAQGALAAALADLPERYRAALVMCYYEGLSNAVAAEALELNLKAMESLLFRARRHLRQQLEMRQLTAREMLVDFAGCAA